MLMKMGYKPEKDHVDPYTIELRRGRAGLGSYEEARVKEVDDHIMRQELEAKRRKEYEASQVSYQQSVHRQEARRQTSGQLFAMLKLCYHFRDERMLQEPGSHLGDLGKHDDPPLLVADVQLRETFQAASGPAIVRGILADMSYEVQLLHLGQLERYLREDFLYCFWCAHSYESQASMKEHCMGATAEAHSNARAPTLASPFAPR